MGEIADTMRSALRQLAQADARLYRGLAEELGDGATAVEEPRALIQPEGGAPATEAQLLALKNDAVEIDDEESLPSEWLTLKTTSQPDKAAIKEALKAGTETTGAQLISRRSWRIH